MIHLVAAIAKDGVIGKDNDMPWHYPEDLAHFKKTTMGQMVLMGRDTFESIVARLGKPLPGRTSIVASRSGFSYPGVSVTDDAIAFVRDFPADEDLFIIGGRQIYAATLNLVDVFHITHIDRPYEGDVRFPTIDFGTLRVTHERTSGDLRFVTYERSNAECS
jgi:dihydrofolate reductase